MRRISREYVAVQVEECKKILRTKINKEALNERIRESKD